MKKNMLAVDVYTAITAYRAASTAVRFAQAECAEMLIVDQMRELYEAAETVYAAALVLAYKAKALSLAAEAAGA